MLEALARPPFAPAEDDVEDEAKQFVPGLPLAAPKRPDAETSWVAIGKGRCAEAKARIMTFDECSAHAKAVKKHFLGRSVDRDEYPGCTLWEDTQLVEFNDHKQEAGKAARCNHGGKGKCVCHLV